MPGNYFSSKKVYTVLKIVNGLHKTSAGRELLTHTFNFMPTITYYRQQSSNMATGRNFEVFVKSDGIV